MWGWGWMQPYSPDSPPPGLWQSRVSVRSQSGISLSSETTSVLLQPGRDMSGSGGIYPLATRGRPGHAILAVVGDQEVLAQPELPPVQGCVISFSRTRCSGMYQIVPAPRQPDIAPRGILGDFP